MSAAPTTAERPNRPDPSPDRAAAPAPDQSRNGRLLSLVRKLIVYGLALAGSLQQIPAVTTLVTVARRFGTRDVALILSRITRALQLAGALEAKLVKRPLPEAVGFNRILPVSRAPCTRRQATPRPKLPEMPTAEEIAAALRNRPMGEVIAEICHDLGIVPAHPLWGEIWMVITEFRGNFVKFIKDMINRLTAWTLSPSYRKDDGWAERWLQAAAGATRPP